MSSVWFTSDTHFGHRKLFEQYQPNRHWMGSTIEEHDETMIEVWNAHIAPRDLVYHLGDLTLDSRPEPVVALLQRLNGHIKVVAGNHDIWITRVDKMGIMPNHVTVIADDKTMKRIRHDGKSMILCHHPIEDWPGRASRPGRDAEDWRSGRWHLHGHSHGKSSYIPGRIDVGWDAHDKILSWDDIKAIIENQE